MSMISSYRISKFKPIDQTTSINYVNDWTSISDVGNVYSGKIFTINQYKQIEKNYIDFYIEILETLSIETLKIECLEDPYNLKRWKNNQQINYYEMKLFFQDCLREKCWGKLKYKKTFFIHFGYDYYTYLGTKLDFYIVDSIANKYNLYCEKIISPYL